MEEYPLELPPQRLWASRVGRERPLQRSRVQARHEAAFREKAANQRWYRVVLRPLSKMDGGVFYALETAERMK